MEVEVEVEDKEEEGTEREQCHQDHQVRANISQARMERSPD